MGHRRLGNRALRLWSSLTVIAASLSLGGVLTLAHGRGIEPRDQTQGRPHSTAANTAAVRSASPGGSGVSATIRRGDAEFQEHCSFCHGADAMGASGPNLARSPLVKKDVNGDLIGPVIRNGRPDKGMPAFPLSDQEIAAIVAFLHARSKQEMFDFGMPKDYQILAGDPRAGKAYFFGKGHCSSCHSPEGDLKGIASKYPPLILMSRIVYPSGTPRTVTVTTASGVQISGELVHLDEFTVSLRDRAGWVRSWNRKNVKVEIQDPLAAHQQLMEQYTDAEIHDLFAYLETLK